MFGNSFNKLIEEDQTPEWLKAGVTVLIPKTENTGKPNNFKLVTCLPKTYKTITYIYIYIYIYNKQDNVKVC